MQNKGSKKGRQLISYKTNKIVIFSRANAPARLLRSKTLVNTYFFSFFIKVCKQKNQKYALTSVLLLNSLAGAFAREKNTFFWKIDFEARFGICVKNHAERSRNQPISMQPARVMSFFGGALFCMFCVFLQKKLKKIRVNKCLAS